MSKELKNKKRDSKAPLFTRIKSYKGITEYKLENGLTVLHKEMPGTGVITTNITYRVGARDEARGETGIAHMLEHMLFKPTKEDLKKKIDSGAMQFERETGCVLNANTWKDRTTYYFSYPKEHFTRALEIEADRMHGVVIDDKEFQPERNNVLSEFDMYFGDPYFALSVELINSAYHSHPYGHETIGFREDIERYTTEMLNRYYEKYYDPHNATLIVVGDVDFKTMAKEVGQTFGHLATKGELPPKPVVVEPKQQGVRRVEVVRPSETQVVAFALKHDGFPQKAWFTTTLLSAILTGGPDSVLYKKIVDKGLASRIEMAIEPTSEENVALLFVTLSKKATHVDIEKLVFEIIDSLTPKAIRLSYKKAQQKIIAEEIIGRESSLRIALELTEYVAAGSWEHFFDTEEILKGITAEDVVAQARKLFDREKMTIGYFISKK